MNAIAKAWADDTLHHLKRVADAARALHNVSGGNATSAGSAAGQGNNATAIAQTLAANGGAEYLRLMGPQIMAYVLQQTRGRGQIQPKGPSIF